MSGKIKGITIEFRGDTTKLDKAIRDINKNTRDLDKELKAVNNALKFNPTNVELWRQKQELLTKKVGETKDKLDLLKQAQAKLDANGVDKTSEEFKKLQRDIIETESKLKTFEAQLLKVGNANLKALSEGFKQAGEKLVSVGNGLSTHVTAPIVAVGAASIKAFNEVKEGLNIVTQKTGATGAELEALHQSVRDLAKEIPASFTDIGTAVGEVSTRFDVNGKQLEDLSSQYLKFAKVNGIDVTKSIDDTQKALAAWGKGADSAPELLDMLTRASQKTGVSVETLTNGLIQNGTALQELNLSLPQSIEFMAQLDKSGANSETVMQGLRKALKNAAKDGVPLDQALSDLQNTIENGSGSVDGLTAAYDLFGKSGDQIYGAVKNGTLDFNALAVAVEDTEGTLNRVFEETLTPAEKFQTTLNSLKDAGYEIGGTLMTVLEPALQKIAEKMQALSEWWGKLSPGMQDAIVKAAMIAAAIGPILIIIGKLATSIGAIIGVINTLGAAVGVLSAGPLVLIIGAIAAVIAIGILLYKNWDKIKETAANIGAKIKEIWTSIKDSVTSSMGKLKDFVVGAWDSLKTTISNAAQSIYDKMTAPFTKAWEIIKGIIEKIKGFFPIDIKDLFSKIKLPHLTVEWTDLTAFGKTISFPSGFDIEWYKKGGIFSSPSIIGVGEAGSEAVVPLDKFWDKLDNMSMASGGITINVYASDGMDENALALKIEQKLVQLQKQRAAAYGNI